ncbi:MAG: ABC transporter permease [Cytophagales bacterium]|nr:ABC transporter permease [Cytophagales bacterium]
MIRNYLTIALRNLLRQKLYSLIAIFGLAIGIAGCLLISLYVADELSYDQYHEKAGRVYRVVMQESAARGIALSSAPFAPALKQEYPEVQQAVRVGTEGGGPIRYGNRQLVADDIFFADPAIFDLFSCRFIEGDPKAALTQPNTIVLTRTLAEKLFSSPAAAVGKTVRFANNFPVTVTGVVEDVPRNSHLRFSGLRALPATFTGGWWSLDLYTYLLLPEGYDARRLEAKLPQFYRKHLAHRHEDAKFQLKLQPVTSIHLHSHLDQEVSANGDLAYVYIFSAIAALVLLIACINYVNLVTARSARRAREVGIRKVVGAGRGQLVGQFLMESLLVVGVAGVLAIGIAHLWLPQFNAFTGKAVSLDALMQGYYLACLPGGAVALGLISGFYPALYLSRFKPVVVLKGAFVHGSAGLLFRQALVVFQFAVSLAMIISTLVVYRQLQYMNRRDLGFRKEQVLTLHINDRATRLKVPVIRQQLLKNPAVLGVAAASNPIGNNNISAGGFYFEEDGKMPEATREAQRFMVDYDFLATMGVALLQGRNFSPAMRSDSAGAVLVNETLVKRLGWHQPLGKRVAYFIDNEGQTAEAKVVGVVRDFHIYSLQHQIEPLVLRLAPPAEQDNLYIRIRPGHTRAALAYIRQTYRQFDPDPLYEAGFLDQNFAKQYEAEERRGQVFLVFALFAIGIACLGLFGLAAYTAEQRTKEIGIRKVLGASVAGIVGLLSKDFIKLVVIAFVLAAPPAWYVMHKWLQDFAYKVDLEWWLVVLAGGLTLLVAVATVTYQSLKAALANPVDSLRSE